MIRAAVLRSLAVVASLASFAPLPAQAATINFAGKEIYLNGANAPWNDFGVDFGCNYSASTFETMLGNMQNAGVNAVRIWVHIDARCSPTLNASGSATGVPTNFYANLDDFMDRARNHNIAVMPVLWSFDMTLKSQGKQFLITDATKTQAYIDNVLVPMVNRYKNHPALFAWEIINEPEWSMADDCDADRHNCVTSAQMQRFVGLQVAAIKSNASTYVTVGSAGFKWNADKNGKINYWNDSSLANASGKANAKLDFYQIHYYDWQKGVDYNDTPWEGRGPSYFLNDGKKVMIGEHPGKADRWYSLSTMINDSFNLGYIGSFPWAYTRNKSDDYGVWDDFKSATKALRDANSCVIDLNLGGSVAPVASACIVCDGPAPDWSDYSWGLDSRNLNNSSPVKSGSKSASVDFQPYGALSMFKGSAQSTSGYSKLGFWVHTGNNAGLKLRIWTETTESGGQIVAKSVSTGTATNTWYWVSVSLSELGSPAIVKRVNIQNDSGANPSVVYFDDLVFHN